MKTRHLNILFPQWQGGGPDQSTYRGSFELKKDYLGQLTLSEIEVSKADIGPTVNNIAGYETILSQLKQQKALVGQVQPDTIFTIGGGCDAGIVPISYLNHNLKSNLTLLWFDAHGDLHTPESSQSKLFFGMPLRTLLGESNKAILEQCYDNLTPGQVIMIGARDLDQAEEQFISEGDIILYNTTAMEEDLEPLIDGIKSKKHGQIYIHLDLDVLDPLEFPHIPVPSPGGLRIKTLSKLLNRLNREFVLIGMGLFEYRPSGQKRLKIIEDIIRLGSSL